VQNKTDLLRIIGKIQMSRIIIFANGELHQPEQLKNHLQPGDRIICADGGARHALALGLIPEIVIGDLDSLPEQTVERLKSAGTRIIRHPVNKDFTDLELAFEWAVAQSPPEIVLVTALGGRLDQMLANILLLTRPEYAAVPLILWDGTQRARLLRPGPPVQISGAPGDTLSLVPLTPQVEGVTLRGVRWPLRNARLHLGRTLSISNQMLGAPAEISFKSGLLLLVQILKHGEENENPN